MQSYVLDYVLQLMFLPFPILELNPLNEQQCHFTINSEKILTKMSSL